MYFESYSKFEMFLGLLNLIKVKSIKYQICCKMLAFLNVTLMIASKNLVIFQPLFQICYLFIENVL